MMASADKQLPKGWKWVKLGEVARIFAGSAAPQGKEFFSSDGPPFVRVSDLGRHGRTIKLMETSDRLSEKALKECQLVPAKKGTVLFPKSGAAIMTNNRAILGRNAYIVSHLIAVEPTDEATSLWLYWSLCCIDMMEYSDNTGYPSLKQSVVESIEIPLPPLSEQKRITAILNEQLAAVEKARQAAKAQLNEINALSASLLRKAFQGEL